MNLNRRNYPPDHGIRLPESALRDLVAKLFGRMGMSGGDAHLLARILAANDRRCLFSHGTRQVPYYLAKLGDGAVNPRPQITVASESPGALVMDGDGGFGYFPCHQGTLKIIEKAKVNGVAALTTRNHQHFGAASNYARLALEHDCIGLSMSAHGPYLRPEESIFDIVNTSPFSIAVPTGQQPALVMDMGGRLLNFDDDLFKQMPTSFLKVMALSAAVRALGGIFPGAYRTEYQPAEGPWEANQGAFIIVVCVSHFMPLAELREEMDRYVGNARQARPLPGMERPELAGGNEFVWEQENARSGIPLGDEHRQQLQEVADEVGVQTPFDKWGDRRF